MENKLKLVYDNRDEKMVEDDVMKRSIEIKKILDESRDLNKLSEELSILVLQQQPDIDTIEQLVENSTFYIKESAKEIKDAAIIKNKMKMFFGAGLFGTIGVGVGSLIGPIGMVTGGSLGALMGGKIGEDFSKLEIKRIKFEFNKIKS
jgi:hypothetical protein